MTRSKYSYQKLLMALIIIGALILVLSGCKPKTEIGLTDSITISAANNATTIITIGGTLQFTANVLPIDADDKSVTWSVKNGTGDATISSSGLLTAVDDGTVTVKATTNDDSKKSAELIITISNQNVVINSISIASEDDIAFINTYHGTLQLSVVVLPENTFNKSVIWSVENGTGSATMAISGLLTAVSDGTVIVKATSSQNGAIYGTMTITLTNQIPQVTSIVIQAPDEKTTINTFGGSLQLSVTILPNNAVDKSITWSVENETGSASITQNGLLTAISNGSVIVHATSTSNPTITDFIEITLTNQQVMVTSIELSSADNIIVINQIGGTLMFSANVLPSDAFNKEVEWSVENGSGEAMISDSGLLSAISDGTVTVIVTSISNPTINVSMVITISNQGIVVTSVTISGLNNATTIEILDGTLQMSALVLPENADDKTVTWSVVNETGVATISTSGLLTAISDGTVTVKAVSLRNNNIYGTKVITISNQNVETNNPAPINLGSADSFTILAKTGISTASISDITGNIGVSPSAASYITGFSLILDATNVYSTSSQVTGMIYASDYALPTPTNLTSSISSMELAYTDASGRTPDYTELYAGDLSSKTLTSGVYKYSTDVLINANLTLSGSATDVIIIQIAGSLTQAAGTQVILTGGILAENIFYQVAGDVSIGTNAHIEGIILCMTSIALNTGASINGKLFSQTAVTLDGNDIN